MNLELIEYIKPIKNDEKLILLNFNYRTGISLLSNGIEDSCFYPLQLEYAFPCKIKIMEDGIGIRGKFKSEKNIVLNSYNQECANNKKIDNNNNVDIPDKNPENNITQFENHVYKDIYLSYSGQKIITSKEINDTTLMLVKNMKKHTVKSNNLKCFYPYFITNKEGKYLVQKENDFTFGDVDYSSIDELSKSLWLFIKEDDRLAISKIIKENERLLYAFYDLGEYINTGDNNIKINNNNNKVIIDLNSNFDKLNIKEDKKPSIKKVDNNNNIYIKNQHENNTESNIFNNNNNINNIDKKNQIYHQDNNIKNSNDNALNFGPGGRIKVRGKVQERMNRNQKMVDLILHGYNIALEKINGLNLTNNTLLNMQNNQNLPITQFFGMGNMPQFINLTGNNTSNMNNFSNIHNMYNYPNNDINNNKNVFNIPNNHNIPNNNINIKYPMMYYNQQSNINPYNNTLGPNMLMQQRTGFFQ